MNKEVIKFIKKNNIIQEFVSRGNLPLIKIENMLQQFQLEERQRIVNRLEKDDIYNSHVGFAVEKLTDEFAMAEAKEFRHDALNVKEKIE